LPEKTSGKTPKTRNLPNEKNVKNNKNTAPKKNELVGKNTKASTAKDKPKVKNKGPKETMQVLIEDKKKSNDSPASELKADKPKVKNKGPKETMQVLIEDKKKSNDSSASELKADKPKVKNNGPKETIQVLIEDKKKSNDTSASELKADKPTSKIAEKISSDLDRKNASYLEPYDEDILFLSDRHRSIVNDVISCLKSNSPFCFLGSESTSYREYYKEIIIDHIKIKEEIELLYFDPKFGDDLSVIINKELKNVDISLIGALNSSISRKILIIDNENFANNLDWELFDSLRLELKVVNIGVFCITPSVLDDKVKSTSTVSNFKAFYLPTIKKSELKELDEYVAKHSYKTKHLETLSSLFMKGSGKDLSDRKRASKESAGFWHKFREYITRK